MTKLLTITEVILFLGQDISSKSSKGNYFCFLGKNCTHTRMLMLFTQCWTADSAESIDFKQLVWPYNQFLVPVSVPSLLLLSIDV